jgi:translation initiation factor IF-1
MDSGERLFEGVITVVKPLMQFEVQLEDGRILDAVISPRMRHAAFRKGDVVRIELSPYNEKKCRIIPQTEENG